MQVTFDPRDPDETAVVLAMLHRSMLHSPVEEPTTVSSAVAQEIMEHADPDVKETDPVAAAMRAKAEAAAAKKLKADEEKKAAKVKADEEAAAKAKADEEVDDGLGPVGDDTPELTLEDVRLALQGYAAIEGRPAAIAILNRHGAKSISELAPEKFRAAYDEAKLRK